MPDGWKFGRVSSVATDSDRAKFTFSSAARRPIRWWCSTHKGKYLRSWGKGMFGNPHGLRDR